jgi:hypothetical protein
LALNCYIFILEPSDVRLMTRKQLFIIMQQQNANKITEKLKCLEKYLLQLDNFSDEYAIKIKHDFSHFKSEMKRRWTNGLRKEEKFMMENKNWLEGTFTIPREMNRSGRPSKSFGESSQRSKRRKTEELRKHTELDVLTYVTRSKLGESGMKDASLVLKEIICTPKRATKYKKAYSRCQRKNTTITQWTPSQALSIFVEADLSRRQYEIIRSSHKKQNLSVTLLRKLTE